MAKLDESILKICNIDNCLDNELVILPQNGDTGFDEYFEYKSQLIRESKRLFTPCEHKLMLRYPHHPKDTPGDPTVFARFFESPAVALHHQFFEGCFAVDITDYKKGWDTDEFVMLLSYIVSNPDIVFLLFMYSDSPSDSEQAYRTISDYCSIRLHHFQLPTPKRLAAYTIERIRSYTLHVNARTEDLFFELFEAHREYGFDAADYYVQFLKLNGFRGDHDHAKELIEEACMKKSEKLRATGFGY